MADFTGESAEVDEVMPPRKIIPREKLAPVPQKGIHRATEDEQVARVEFCYARIREQMPKSKIKTEFREVWGDVNAKTIENYLSEARKLLVADAADGKDVMTAQAYSMLVDVATDKEAQDQDRNKFNTNKINAVKTMAVIFGLNAPTKIAPTDPTGEKEYESLTDEERASRIAAIFDAARARRDGSASEAGE